MSTDHHSTDPGSGQPPRHSDVTFEPRDVNTRTILLYLFYLALAVAATFFVSIYIFRFTTELVSKSDTAVPPMRQGVEERMPPEPRLQGVPGHMSDPQQDLRDKISADEAANKKLGWVDQSTGIAQIPVEEAMKIIVAKGLPAVAAAPAGKKR
ncbi:MAG TPA: hypothetical protein VMI32_00775 [Candidatus Solibacter sp.]|nr:hypothetical protein [Candidatus Solibacter sp.]